MGAEVTQSKLATRQHACPVSCTETAAQAYALKQPAALQVMGSEVGVVDIPNWDIASKGRLMPGNIFLVDFDAGRVIKDEEVLKHPASIEC